MKQVIIHGENALVPIDKMPKGKVEHYTKYIIGHSETGHHHVLESVKGKEFDILVDGEDIYISTKFESSVVHKKTSEIHKTVKVKPGIYKVNRKQEYDPFLKVRRAVFD